MLTIAERTKRTVMMVTVRGSIDPELDDLAARQVRNEGYKRLAVAIITQACRDARYQPRGVDPQIIRERTATAYEARAWLAGKACAELLEALGIEQAAVMAWLDALPALPETERI